MERKEENKRVFFAFEAFSPWPQNLPEGRKLESTDRHLTIAFLGNIHYPSLEKILSNTPLPKIKVGIVGKFDRCLFLPPKRPNVVAWHVKWFDEEYDLGIYQKEMADWLGDNGFSVRINPKGFLPHATLSRRPFKYHEWREAFQVIPVVIKDIHLYESVGKLRYKPLWSHHLLAPFDITKTDTEYRLVIRGENLTQLFHHCLTAIAFQYPYILRRYGETLSISEFSDLLPNINAILKKAAKKIPLPFQELQTIREPEKNDEGVFSWEAKLPIL